VANPMQRISLEGIQQHPWFLKNLPAELANPGAAPIRPEPKQSVDDIQRLVAQARTVCKPALDGIDEALAEAEEEDGGGYHEGVDEQYMAGALPC